MRDPPVGCAPLDERSYSAMSVMLELMSYAMM